MRVIVKQINSDQSHPRDILSVVLVISCLDYIRNPVKCLLQIPFVIKKLPLKTVKKIVANVFLKKSLKVFHFVSIFTALSRAVIRSVLQITPDSFLFVEPCRTSTV